MRENVTTPVENLEVITPYIFPPWQADPKRAVDITEDREVAFERCLANAATGPQLLRWLFEE
jgi:hypothetical protein